MNSRESNLIADYLSSFPFSFASIRVIRSFALQLLVAGTLR